MTKSILLKSLQIKNQQIKLERVVFIKQPQFPIDIFFLRTLPPFNFQSLSCLKGGGISNSYKYAGFISYAHRNEAIAARLHKALETYPIPKSLAKKDDTALTRKKLTPIFRDATELTAHHSLSEKIREAVEASRFLIVICSPAAKASHWVNEEIRLFRASHGESSILCVLADGTPETSFPPALLEDGREPLAANISGTKESFKQGTTQLAASMLGVGLDVLIQRQAKRRRTRLKLVTAAALAFSACMGTTAIIAIDARNEAQESRSQAEGLVEYMITDLKDKLEPLGKLDLLDSVGDKAIDYYNGQDITKLSDESLIRQARARHILGQVAYDAFRKEDAIREIEFAAMITTDVLKRRPNDPQAIFAHAHSEHWLGKLHYGQGNLDGVLKHWGNHEALAEQLVQIDPSNTDWVMEVGDAKNNLGNISSVQKKHDLALSYFEDAIDCYNLALSTNPNHRAALIELANSYSGASNSASEIENHADALNYKTRQIEIYDNILQLEPGNYQLIYKRAIAKEGILWNQLILKDSDIYKKLVAEVSEGFKISTQRDPDNKTWSRNYEEFKDKFESVKSEVKIDP